MRRALLLLPLLTALPAAAQTTTLQSDDGTMEQMWSLTSPNAGPGDWIGVAYSPPFEFPFRVVSASMFYLDSYCCAGSTCGDGLCVGGADWDRRIIGFENITLDPAGLTPNLTTPVASQTSIAVDAGATATAPPWTLTPNVWTLPAQTVFDHPGRVFYAIKWFDQDQWMRFAVDNSGNAGTSIFTNNGFSTRSSIWSFGNVGMRIVVEPLFSLKLAAQAPAASFQLAGTTGVTLLALRVGAGNAPTGVSRVRVSAAGTGDDAAAVSAVRLVLDANANGQADAGELTLATGSYAANNGAVDLNFNRTLATGTAEHWLVVYDFNALPTGGQTFTARINAAADVVSGLGAPYLSGTTQGAGPLAGGTVTIAGRLVVSRGPASPPAQVVAAGASNVAALQLRLTAENEAMSVTALTVTADGTLNDLTGSSSVRLYTDPDGNGQVSTGDVQLAQGSFTQDNGRLAFTFPAQSILANTSRDLLVVSNLAATVSGGDSYRYLLAQAADLSASGVSSGALPALGPRSLQGTPVIGNLLTVGGALSVSLGAANPPAGTAQPGASAVPMLQLSLAAQAEAVSFTTLTLRGSGTGDEVADVARARLYRDTNANGLVDGADVAVGLPQSYAANDGLVTFAFAPEVIPANGARSFLVAYDFTAAPTGGETFSVRLAAAGDLTLEGQASGAPITASGAFPLGGNTRTLLGGLSVVLASPQTPAASHQPGAADVPVLGLTLAAQGESFTVSTLRVTAAGSLDDGSGVVRAELWRDLGAAGVRDAPDVLLGTAAFAGDDGTLTFGLAGEVVSPGAPSRWLVSYDLSASAVPGQSFRAAVLLATDLSASGALSGPATPSGPPLTGNTQSVGGVLVFAPGGQNPGGGSIAAGAPVVMSQLRLSAQLEPITLTSLTVSGQGSGNELTGVSAASLWVDTDLDGQLDLVGDLRLGTPQAFTQNDGALAFAFAPRTIPAGASELWLVVYELSAAAQAGETFQAGVLANTDLAASAPSGPLPRAQGAPVLGGARTVLGTLRVARGPANPAARTVARNAQDVSLLQLAVSAEQESFTLTDLTVSAIGSVDDAGDLAGLRLYQDTDGDGSADPGEPLLAGPLPFSGDDGELALGGLTVSVNAGATLQLLLVTSLTGQATGGSTLRLSVGPADLVASGFGGRGLSPVGLPISSNTLTAGGSLDVQLGPASPLSRVVQRGAAAVPALQLRLVATTEATTVTRLTVHGSGSGHDAQGTTAVGLYLDANSNGRVDAGDLSLASGSFTADDGTIDLAPNHTVAVGPAAHYLLVSSFSATPVGGDTFRLSLDPQADLTLASSSGSVRPRGAAMDGAILTAGGGFVVALGPQAGGGAPVNQSAQNVPVLQLDLRAENEACTVDSLTLRAFGSIDDAADVQAVRILRDVNDNGVADFADVAVGQPGRYLRDDGTLTFAGLGAGLGLSASERWLLVYDLAGTASNLESFGARLENPADLVVSCSVSGPVSPLGTPVTSGVFTIQQDGALVLSRGASTPLASFVPAGSVRAPALQLRLQAAVQDVTLERLALTADAPAGVVAEVELFRDADQDGILDRQDPPLGARQAPDPSGRVAFDALALAVPLADAQYLLATVSLAASAAPGATVTLRLADNTEAVARSALGPAISTGAPISGHPLTIAGKLNVRDPGSAALRAVKNDAQGLAALTLELSALSERFTLESLTVTAEGAMVPTTAVASLSLWADADGDGALGGADRAVAQGLTFPQGARRTSFAGLREVVDPARPLLLFVSLDLAGKARVDEDLRLSLAADVDLTARGDDVGPSNPVGAPLVGPRFVIGPSLELALGPAPPQPAIVAANAERVPALQLALRAFNEDVTVSRLALKAQGSLDDAIGVENVRLFLDVAQNGQLDPEDLEVARARPAGDDGAVSFAPLSLHLPPNGVAVYLAALDLSGAGSAGQDVTLSLASDADVTAFGTLSGGVAATGAPLSGARVSLVGALNVLLGPASPAGSGVNPGQTFAALQLALFTSGETVVVDRALLSLEGTADDAAVISRARLVRDLDGDGAVGDLDLPLADARPDGNDGKLAFESVGLSIAADEMERMVVELELAAEAPVGGTLRVSLLADADLRATGASTGPVTAVGAPVSGSAFTVVRAPEARGSAAVDEGCACSAHRPAMDPRAPSPALALLLLGLGLSRRARWPGGSPPPAPRRRPGAR